MKNFIYMLCVSANFVVYAQGEGSDTESNVKKSSLVDSDRSFDSKEGMLPVDKRDSKNVITSINPENVLWDNKLNHAASTKQYDNSRKNIEKSFDSKFDSDDYIPLTEADKDIYNDVVNKMVDVLYEEDENDGNKVKKKPLRLTSDKFENNEGNERNKKPLRLTSDKFENYNPEIERLKNPGVFSASHGGNELLRTLKEKPVKTEVDFSLSPSYEKKLDTKPSDEDNPNVFVKEKELTDKPKNSKKKTTHKKTDHTRFRPYYQRVFPPYQKEPDIK